MVRWDDKRGTWRVVVNLARGGQRRRFTRDVHAPNSRAGAKVAELAEARLRLEVDAMPDEGPRVVAGTFADSADAWVSRNRGRWSPKTLKETTYALNRSILPTLGRVGLDNVTPRQVEAMYADWTAGGYSASTMRRWHGMVRSVYADAERLGELHGPNPMVRVRPAGGKAPERRIPSPDDVRRVIAAAPNALTAVCFELAAATGARRGTLVALRWRDVDLDAGTVSFVQSVAEGADGPVLKQTKANRAYAVNIAGTSLATLREAYKRAAEAALRLGLAGGMGDLFVFSRDGGQTHWNVSWPTHSWYEACVRAGVTPCRLHDVRHFAATRLLAEGVAHSVVAARLGCTEANVVRTYSHRVATADDARAADIMAALLG